MSKNIKEEVSPKDGTPTSKKTFKQSTKAELSQRLTEVQSLILQGYTRHAILQYGSKWNLSDRQIDDYTAKATALIKEINKASIQDNLAIITTNQFQLLIQAKKDGNLAVARQLLMDLAKLKGLEQTYINHTISDVRDLENVSNEELDSLLNGTSDDQH